MTDQGSRHRADGTADHGAFDRIAGHRSTHGSTTQAAHGSPLFGLRARTERQQQRHQNHHLFHVEFLSRKFTACPVTIESGIRSKGRTAAKRGPPPKEGNDDG
jgi:hypothetical protein